MKKIVYITGCLGFIGSYVTRACLKKGWYVRGIDKVTYASNIKLLDEFEKNPNFVFEREDINNIKFLYECDYIINTAAETHVGNRNYRGEGKDKPTLLHFSTDEVYGDVTDGEHLETDILKPSNPYSATKAAADQLILAWARTYNLPYVIVRPTNNYGIGQYTEKLIPKTCKCLSLGKKIPLHNNGSPIRNWLHASDTAEAIITIIESNIQNEIYNIAGGFEQANFDTVQKVITEYTREDIDLHDYIDLSYSRAGQDVRYALNDNKLKNLGWKSKRLFDYELPKIVKYYKKNFIW